MIAMNIFTASARHSLAALIRDPQVRAGMYLWLVVAGICVLAANAGAAMW